MPTPTTDRTPHRFPTRAAPLVAALALGIAAAAVSPVATAVEAVHPPSVALAPADPGAGAWPAGAPPRFERLGPEQTGIDFTNRWGAAPEFEGALSSSFVAGGVALGDVDGDGRTDLYLSRPFGGGRLYLNRGGFRFEDATAPAGLAPARGEKRWEAGPSLADIDGDGDLDLFLCVFSGPDRLFLNRGKTGPGGGVRFEECAAAAGLDFGGASVIMAFADYDGDGDLDGYLVTNRAFSPDGAYRVSDRRVAQRIFPQLEKDGEGRHVMPEHLREIFEVIWNPYGEMDMFVRAGQYDRLYRNDGAGGEGGVPRFTEVAAEAGLRDNGMGLSATWWDFDHDGRPDLYVANDYYGADRLFHNRGDGTFAEVTGEALPHTPWYSMGTDVADINNDGRLDFMGSDMLGTDHFRQKVGMGDMAKNAWFLDTAEPRQYMRNALYLNSGTGRFLECAQLCGVAQSDWTWALKFGDLDCDGRVDLFIANGMSGDFFNSDISRAQREGTYLQPGQTEPRPPPKRDPDLAFRHAGDLRFENVSREWGLDRAAASFGAALGDLDGDGDLDLVVNHFEDPVSVYRNRVSGGNRRALVRLEGRGKNRWGIGATVRAWVAGAGVQTRYHTLTRGFYASDEPGLHFGLGGAEKIDRLTVEWPSGAVQEFRDLPAGRRYTVAEPGPGAGGVAGEAAEGESAVRAPPPPFREERRRARGRPLFEAAATPVPAAHRETVFDDFHRQPLLPQKHSQLGPGTAWGDVDGDGDDDAYLGGARGDTGQLLLNEGGRLRAAGAGAFAGDRPHEDMGAVFFDADGDGDRDLFVVSGGVECSPGDPSLRDRLYLNDGAGKLRRAPASTLPDRRASGGPVGAADFDRDGDLDLFVGGRVVPGRYPETPPSQLLRNDGRGRFSDATPRSLRSAGMVTAALWSDVDGDGWPDLLVAHDWGPVRIFHNRKGTLEDVTSDSGIAALTGWWNSLAGADIDGDGDTDYAAGNLGLNSPYHAAPGRPALLYYGDLDGTGRPRIVEAIFEGETCFPFRGKSCSTHAMPGLGRRFPTFAQFARASLEEIYTPARLAGAERLEATTFASGLLINETPPGGPPRFSFRPLPRLAQVAPAYGLAFTEVDGDGRPDLYLAQNFFGPQRETGRLDGGVSLLLRNAGGGDFEPVWPDRSGLLVPGDATALTTADLDADGRPDFFVALNDARPLVFLNRGGGGAGVVFALQLQGGLGNPDAAGARVSIHMRADAGGATPNQTAEVYAGGGYLSQSSPRLFFGLGTGGEAGIDHIAVRWPDGAVTRHLPGDLPRSGGTAWLQR